MVHKVALEIIPTMWMRLVRMSKYKMKFASPEEMEVISLKRTPSEWKWKMMTMDKAE